jgi:AraC-like DNA-binding protein
MPSVRSGASLVDLAAYQASPIGKATASEHVLAWFVVAELRILAFWGRPNDRDARFLVEAMAPEVGPRGGAYCSIVDLREVEDLSPVGFQGYLEFASAHADTLGARVIHSAIVHRGGPTAALAAGYSRLLKRPFPSSLHLTLADAIEATGRAVDGASATSRLEQLVAEAKARHEIEGLVERYVRASLRGATLEGCARGLALSERTLQRLLQERGTSFREELSRVRLDEAMRLLREGDGKLISIAHEVGYPKLQNLSIAFRKRTGMTPGAWRAQLRGRASDPDPSR